jgi:hypothetical protein
MATIQALNLALRFLLELCMLAALGYWGWHTGGTPAARVALGLGAPLLAATMWGRWLAPKARRRLSGRPLLALELLLFALAVAALFAVGAPGPAVALGLIYAANKTLSLIWEQ